VTPPSPDLLRTADAAMYAAKRGGHGMVFADELPA
jgi:hypothetical protein